MSTVLYRKYRPMTFSDVTDQEHVKKTIQNQIASDNLAHAYLFTGPRGVGKTTVARLIAKAVNCEKKGGKGIEGNKGVEVEPCNKCASCKSIMNGSAMDVVEIDAASHTDVENVRENIIKNVRFPPSVQKKKVYIIDEVHMLSAASFNALLKTLEEPPAHALFILATTEIHKVPATIISRCQRFDFHRVSVSAMVIRLKKIAKKEGVEVTDDVLQEVARHSEGGMRDAESLFGQILALGEKRISMDEASLVLPATTTILVLDFLEMTLAGRAPEAISLLNAYTEQGVDMPHFLDDVTGTLRNFLFALLGDLSSVEEQFDKETLSRVQTILESTSQEQLTRAIEIFLAARRGVKTDKIPQLSLELAVLSLASSSNFSPKGVGSSREKVVPPPAVPVKEPVAVVETEAPEKVILETTAAALGSVPVVSLEEVKRKWPQVFKQLQETNATLPVVVQSGRLCGVGDDHVEITFDFELHAEVVNKDQNRRTLEGIMEKVFGKPLYVRATYGHRESDEAVSSLIEEFGGNVV